MSFATVAVKVKNILEILRPDIFIRLSRIIRLTLSKKFIGQKDLKVMTKSQRANHNTISEPSDDGNPA